MTIPRHDMPLDLEPSGLVSGRYAVDREIGRGGTAIVYLARDVRTSRQVALKVLKPEFAGSLTTRRFLNEIALTTGLQHPHILAIQDSGEVSGIPGLDGLPFHVSPYIEGESLRARLERERQLPLDDAIRIAAEIADALEYAHAHGVLHRDVKPENILLSGHHACVADFGIARAFARAAGDRLTTTGVTVGTPAYMSPEQASGERELDARTDVYSLACVVYEMIAGVPPFMASTPQAVIAQRFTHPPRPLEVYRPNLPPHVEEAISRAMALLPADRTPSAQALADALGGSASAGGATSGGASSGAMPWRAGTGQGAAVTTRHEGGARPGTVARKRWTVAAMAALVLAGALYLGDDVARAARRVLGPAPDPTRYVVLPFTGIGGQRLGPDVARQQLHEALGRWRDLELVSLAAADRETPDGATELRDRLAAARALDAGRAVSVQVSRAADSVQLRATLYGGRGQVLGEQVVRVPDAAGAHDGYRRLATALLRASPPPADTDEGDLGTDLLDAWRAYTRGHEARHRWELEVAEREFRAAATADPGFAQAQLWAAQVAAWQHPDDPSGWRDAASRAVARIDRLTPRDALLARGVHALATEQYPEACAAYADLQRIMPGSDVPWYGIGQCNAIDQVVARDAGSPSGWRFRSSYHAAVAAYDSAIALAGGAPAFAFERLRDLLMVESTSIRTGYSANPEATSFGAYPSLDADTLAFVPWPARDLASGSPRTVPATFDLALRRNAEMLGSILNAWVERAPESADALEALALVQEVRGARGAGEGGEGSLALATITRARELGADPEQQVELASSQVRLLLKEGRFDDARRLADSVLSSVPRADAREVEHLLGLAALTGKVDRATQLMRMEASVLRAGHDGPSTPPAVLDQVAPLMSHAMLGACSDSMVRRMEQSVEAVLERHVSALARSRVRNAVLARPLSLAVPCAGRSLAGRVPYTGARLALMQRAYATGDHAAVRAHLDTLMQARHQDRPGDVTIDQTYQEAWLLVAIGDTAAATRHLDLTLTAMETLGTQMLRDPAQAAAVGRAMALRAALARAQDDRDVARSWAVALAALWATADLTVRHQVQEVRQAAGRP